MALVSKKKRKEVADAIRLAAGAVLNKFAPEWRDGTPETWEPETRRLFDYFTEMEMSITEAVDAALAA